MTCFGTKPHEVMMAIYKQENDFGKMDAHGRKTFIQHITAIAPQAPDTYLQLQS